MTLPVTVTLLALWTIAMARYGRSLLFPPATLAGVWTGTLLILWLCGNLYFPLTMEPEAIVLTGVLAFSLGGIASLAAPLWPGRTLMTVPPRRRRPLDRFLTAAVRLLLLNI